MSSLSEKLYASSPAFLQTCFLSLYGVDLYFREYGKSFRKLLEEFERHEKYSNAQLEEYQDEKLRSLIIHCYNNVPYYRRIMDERGLKPKDIESVSELSKLPLLTGEDVRTNFDQLLATNVRLKNLRLGRTSGTTGAALVFYYDRTVCLVKNVVDWRQKRWAGINPGDKIAFFLGRVVVPTDRHKPPFWRTNWTLNHKFFSSFHLAEEHLDKYIDELVKYSPAALDGYPAAICTIAKFLLSRGEIIPLKAVFTSSETLFPQQREAIESAFQCSLFDFYGAAERVAFATECEFHQGKHLNSDFGITEILDRKDQAVAPGQMGRIIATGLHNYAMPFIRYKTNDVTSISSSSCSCGRTFPLMDHVTTKAEDVITTPDGRQISPASLTHPFKQEHHVYESQIIQWDQTNLTIKIVREPGYNESDTQFLREEVGKRVGVDMNIKFEFVESIPRTKAGKFRWIISHVPLES